MDYGSRARQKKNHITAHIDGPDWAAWGGWRRKKGLIQKSQERITTAPMAPKVVLSISTLHYTKEGFYRRPNTAWEMSILSGPEVWTRGAFSTNTISQLLNASDLISNGSFCILS
ncbi:hypothetical protein VI817_009088 [Penicillium citrinum]|uniref:Uncharacterized protein n=1 Tax=Penicillium hetheringtonii TaxID=911720 RepID=A0AAD6GS32_9EURO|nr:hypothetical protein N7450_007607 [Penicillium hetheringtonii]KAK5788130.1 hypothetical protein VI817_009088 [Penicillium citrinum]